MPFCYVPLLGLTVFVHDIQAPTVNVPPLGLNVSLKLAAPVPISVAAPEKPSEYELWLINPVPVAVPESV